MDRKEMETIKARIQADYLAKIEKLKEEMKADLAAVSRVASYFESPSKEGDRPRVIRRYVPESTTENKTPGARDRIIAAKARVHGPFIRKTLHEAVNSDGFGEMKEGTFSPYVSRIIADGEIIEIEKAMGTKPSTYMWPEEYTELQSRTSTIDEDDIPL
jgi:hypothetical protein